MWGKKGVRAIKKGCIEFLNRKGENFDWENDNLSDLEVVSEQPKAVDPGVADIPLDNGPYEELGGASEVKEKAFTCHEGCCSPSRAGLRR